MNFQSAENWCFFRGGIADICLMEMFRLLVHNPYSVLELVRFIVVIVIVDALMIVGMVASLRDIWLWRLLTGASNHFAAPKPLY